MRAFGGFKVLGVVFLCLLLAGVYLTYAAFTKKFTAYDRLTLEAPAIGQQLPMRADVKIRGVIVGQVLGFSADAAGAKIDLGIDPDQLHLIPANVTGSIVPKTLFGEKYVALVIPAHPAPEHIQPDATIPRTQLSTEVEQVLSDVYPLLRTVQPADLNMTLNALATALEGRGEQLGRNLETLNGYLKRINPQLPQLIQDLRLTSRASDTWAAVMPQVGDILRNTVRTTTTLRDRAVKLKALLDNVASFSDTARQFLSQNGDNLIRLGQVGEQQLAVFARYAPEFPCLTKGLVSLGKREAEAFRGFTLHIVLETIPNQPRGYGPQDEPHFGDDRAPSCLQLPNPPFSQANPARHQPNFDDGVDEPTGKGIDRVTPDQYLRQSGFTGSPMEARLLKSLIGPALGDSPSEVPDLGVLLMGPMARGAEVSLR